MAAFCVQDQAGLDPETVRVWRFLDSQGCHFVLVNQSKIPIHRRWQLPWERPSLDKVLRHLAGGGMVGHVPAAVGCVVLDLDESDDGGRAFMDVHPPFWDIPSRRSGGMHMYYLSRVQYGNRDWRMGSAAGQLRSRNGFVVIWDPHALADMLAHRTMFEFSPEDHLFPAAALGARTQQPQDWGLRTPPPRREQAERRRPSQPPLPGIDAPPVPPGATGGRPAGGMGAQGTTRSPVRSTGSPGGCPWRAEPASVRRRQIFRLLHAPGTGRAGDVRPVGPLHPGLRRSLQRAVYRAPERRGRGEDGEERVQNSAGPTRASGVRWTWGDGTARCSAAGRGWG